MVACMSQFVAETILLYARIHGRAYSSCVFRRQKWHTVILHERRREVVAAIIGKAPLLPSPYLAGLLAQVCEAEHRPALLPPLAGRTIASTASEL